MLSQVHMVVRERAASFAFLFPLSKRETGLDCGRLLLCEYTITRLA